MKKTTIIYGQAQNLNRALADKMITVDANVCRIDGRSITKQLLASNFLFSQVEKNTNLILIDDIHFTLIARLMNDLLADELLICKRGQWPFHIPKPEVIITVETHSFQMLEIPPFAPRRFNLINIESYNDYQREVSKIQDS